MPATVISPSGACPEKKRGAETMSALNLKIAKLLPEDDLVLIEGAVPGPKGTLVTVRGAVKKKNGGKKKA